MIKVNLDRMLARRNMTLTDLAGMVGITCANLSRIKCNKARSIRFDTLDSICRVLECDVADLLEFVDEPD